MVRVFSLSFILSWSKREARGPSRLGQGNKEGANEADKMFRTEVFFPFLLCSSAKCAGHRDWAKKTRKEQTRLIKCSGPSFFPSFYAQVRSARAMKTGKKGKRPGSITCCTDRANEANKMSIIWLC